MSLKTKIQADLKKSLQEKNALRCSVLRMLKAAILNKEKEKRAKLSKSGNPLTDGKKLEELSKLTDEEIIEAVKSEAKKRKDSIYQYEKGNRPDLAEQEKKELTVLTEYLPEQISEGEIRKIAKETILKTGAKSPQDIGRVMGVLMSQIKSKADGGLVSKIVEEELRDVRDS